METLLNVCCGLVTLTFRSLNSFMRPFVQMPRGFSHQAMSGGVSRDQFVLAILRGVADTSADRAYLDNKTDVGAYFSVHKGMSDAENAQEAMALYDGTQISIDAAVSAIDNFYQAALNPVDGEFLLKVVGVLDNTLGD